MLLLNYLKIILAIMSSQEKETSNSLYRQWQILSRLSTGKWMGTRELQETLIREGIDISLRTIQRDLTKFATVSYRKQRNITTRLRWRPMHPFKAYRT